VRPGFWTGTRVIFHGFDCKCSRCIRTAMMKNPKIAMVKILINNLATRRTVQAFL
jgi:hypothetical protein